MDRFAERQHQCFSKCWLQITCFKISFTKQTSKLHLTPSELSSLGVECSYSNFLSASHDSGVYCRSFYSFLIINDVLEHLQFWAARFSPVTILATTAGLPSIRVARTPLGVWEGYRSFLRITLINASIKDIQLPRKEIALKCSYQRKNRKICLFYEYIK